MNLVDKYKKNGFMSDGDILVQGTFKLSGKDIGKGTLKSILLLIFTLGMFYTVPTAKMFFMAASDKRLNLLVDNKMSEMKKEDIASIEIKKIKNNSIVFEIKLHSGQLMTLIARSYKKTATPEQIAAILRNYNPKLA